MGGKSTESCVRTTNPALGHWSGTSSVVDRPLHSQNRMGMVGERIKTFDKSLFLARIASRNTARANRTEEEIVHVPDA